MFPGSPLGRVRYDIDESNSGFSKQKKRKNRSVSTSPKLQEGIRKPRFQDTSYDTPMDTNPFKALENLTE